jgi:hypothetical protein
MEHVVDITPLVLVIVERVFVDWLAGLPLRYYALVKLLVIS